MTDPSLTPDELSAIAVDAYVYLYPLVLMETTRRVATNWLEDERVGVAPMGVFAHSRSFPSAKFRTIVRPNFDTLYSSAWVDVEDEPYLVSLPEIRDRFFMLPLYDMWTDVFASPGTRTHGSGPITFALCSPGWHGTLPTDTVRIDAPTPTVWLLGRTETRGVDDYATIHNIQDQLRLAPLSTWPDRAHATTSKDLSIDMRTPPMVFVDQMTPRDFFFEAASLVARQGVHPTDWNVTARMARTGFEIGAAFDLDLQSEEVVTAFNDAPARARRAINARGHTIAPLANGWSTISDLGVYANSYLKRAMIARWGLGANPTEESIYPNLQVDDQGRALHGSNGYVIRFAPGQLPPVDAFWSLTVYDRQGFHVANSIDRFAIGDRDDLEFEPDGSLTITLAHNPPEERRSNWLPVPEDDFVVTMRLYLPHPEALTQHWNPPVATRLG